MNAPFVSTPKVAALLFGSGACALVYQVAWLRELRLVFGASTAATAAVLAIFMAGLGAGSAVLGRRADRAANPLRMYAHLELGIAACAAITPFLLMGVRAAYIAVGGSSSLGAGGATALRLLLSALILGLPTFLMGGTLPSAARAVERAADAGRRQMATLYGLNTLGAVSGVVLSTFIMIELFGTRSTLWLACLANALVAMTARALARGHDQKAPAAGEARPGDGDADGPPAATWILMAAAVVGFVFLLMEIVWYRMLGPLLGGSTYTFGLILAVALLGIGLGGAIYALGSAARRPTPALFALTCALEALFFAAPFAAGDRIAVLAALLHPLGGISFAGRIAAWTVVTAIVVLPGAMVSGYQFPVLVGLLGAGERGVGRHTGLAYAWNTVGAIAGSLAGGFLLLPWLSATGCWQLSVIVLVALAVGVVVLGAVRGGRRITLAAASVVVLTALLLTAAEGPTSAWRQSPIGAGRLDLSERGRNGLKNWINGHRRAIVWEGEGVESSVGIAAENGLAFIVNGKTDGNARADAATQVGLGLIGAAIHPNPRSAMVIGLGTGSSAGWLAAIPSIESVDVAELEPAILEVARRCGPVNLDVLENPKVQVLLGDGRELLLTTGKRYDLIASEPSNPYRAGIASLYTREFYQAIRGRLAPGGIFSQWVQGYEVDTRTMRTIYTTLASVFPHVETWQTKSNDLLLVCTEDEISIPVPELRRRLQSEPFKAAFLNAWSTTDVEGFLAHFVARSSLASTIAREDAPLGWLNTDDRMLVEYGMARTVGVTHSFTVADTTAAARRRSEDRPRVHGGTVDWQLVDDNRLMVFTNDGQPTPRSLATDEAQRHRAAALDHFLLGSYGGVLDEWSSQQRPARYPLEIAMLGEALASLGEAEALSMSRALAPMWPAVAHAIEARLHWQTGDSDAAVTAIDSAFSTLRAEPWGNQSIMLRALRLIQAMAERDPTAAPHLQRILAEPFSVSVLDSDRRTVLLEVAKRVNANAAAAVVATFEPHVPWNGRFLEDRLDLYRAANHPLVGRAEEDLEDFARYASPSLNDTLR